MDRYNRALLVRSVDGSAAHTSESVILIEHLLRNGVPNFVLARVLPTVNGSVARIAANHRLVASCEYGRGDVKPAGALAGVTVEPYSAKIKKPRVGARDCFSPRLQRVK